ncbi:MAG: energy transducer TonB [Verrucomicrobia bacterium]|nr:energy transducer TonB [Verrucomicrobiota bacterium]
MTLSPPFRIDSFFLLAGLTASAALHAGFFLSPWHPTTPRDFAVQPSDFSLEISRIETSAGQPESTPDRLLTTSESTHETTPTSQASSAPPSDLIPEPTSRLNPNPRPTVLTPSQASSLVLARPDPSQNTAPVYPDYARKKGWHGSVLLRAQVSSHGTVESITLLQGSGYSLLDEAAAAAVRKWRFFPKKVDGQATSSLVDIPVKFSLKH